MDITFLNPQLVLRKREKIRNDLKIKLNKTNYFPKSEKTDNDIPQPAGVRRRKKTSQNLKSFDSMSIFKEKAVSKEFEEFFQLKEKLGQGAQSVVYRCVEKKSGEHYAVKLAKQRDPELMENMRQCYQILMELESQLIIKGYQLHMNQKKLTCHLVCELCQYQNLNKFILNQRKKNNGMGLPEEQAIPILSQLLECVDYLQRKGVCHRDIKPQNILYDPETGKLKLIDFGLARMERYAHENLELLSKTGTLHYRAPETFTKVYGRAVDMWSVGIVAYELLIGTVPFKSSSSATTIKLIQEEEIKYQSLNLSKKAIHFLERILEKNPQKRLTAKQALSEGFILKNSKKSPTKKEKKHSCSYDDINSTFEQNERKSDNQSRCYDEDSILRMKHTQDIGVRIFQESKQG